MQIAGLQKTTLVDYPGKVAATVFTRGCSFRCPFCHNPELVLPEKFNPLMPIEYFFDFLENRQGKLQGICITGGEPLLHHDIGQFISQIKKMGFAVKLDTNGSFPDRLETLLKEGNIDYIAMDIKAPINKYNEVAAPVSLPVIAQPSDSKLESKNHQKLKQLNDQELESKIKRSIKLIMESGVEYEFRTTVCHPLHCPDDFKGIGEMIKGANKFFIQNFVRSKHNNETIAFDSFTEIELNQSLEIIKRYLGDATIR